MTDGLGVVVGAVSVWAGLLAANGEWVSISEAATAETYACLNCSELIHLYRQIYSHRSRIVLFWCHSSGFVACATSYVASAMSSRYQVAEPFVIDELSLF